jgi:hypothetical protein
MTAAAGPSDVSAIMRSSGIKAYVLSLTESLSEELKGTGVSITALCPGITATNMLTKATTTSSKLGRLPPLGVVNAADMLASRATPKWLLRRIGGALGRKSI